MSSTIGQRPKTLKQKTLDYLGYDANVTAAASTGETVRELTSDVPGAARGYVQRLFPFTNWILHYNLTWALGDLIAGLTVGMVVVPQSMSYAKIATLSPEYGLYSSFVGVMIYAIFATSKDVTIGPVAVMSLLVSKVIADVQSRDPAGTYAAPVIATALAFITGFIVLGIGLLRLGWIVEFIPVPAVAGFMTGSAISIAAGQVAGLMGYSSKFNTRAATYKVIIWSFKFLPSTTKDAAFGLTALFFLYFTRWLFGRLERKTNNPVLKKVYFFAATMRTAIVIIFLTLAAYLHLRHKTVKHYDISVLKTVPAGFKHMGTPVIDRKLLSLLGPQIPVATIILLLEHIAISKSFGRVNNYKIDPNQELIAIGVTNTIGTLFNAYPATGSFSRSAVKAKAGVRTPLAGWITGIVVVVALYALTGAFYWIPNAALSAVIIHAVGDLIASPRQVYGFWKVSPIEATIWFTAVIVTIFTTIEIGVYTSVAASGALLLYRIARPRGSFLGRVRVHSETLPSGEVKNRDVWIPLKPATRGYNPDVKVEDPSSTGVLVYRPDESVLYPNVSWYCDVIADTVRAQFRSGVDYSLGRPGDRPWNDPGPSRWHKAKQLAPGELSEDEIKASRPLLRAIIFDFSGVSALDTTSVQNFVDLHRQLERYTNGPVEFHFANLITPWIQRGLLAGGFGTGDSSTRPFEVAAVVPAGTEVPHSPRVARRFPRSPPNGRAELPDEKDLDIEESVGGPVLGKTQTYASSENSYEAPIISPMTANFHFDVSSAVAAVAGHSW